MRGALIIILVNYCAFLFSQELAYSGEFDTKRQLVPLQIINNHPDYFYVLRYAKLYHDFLIERRAKPDGRILALTPLRLDSVNADWFDYEKLEYLFFEQHNKVYFVFEKTLNTKKIIYLKIADTTGRSSGFIELGTLDPDKAVSDFNFYVKRAGDKLLVVGSQYFLNNTSKKIALLYDLEKRERTWVKKLPLENPYTGFSMCFTASAHNDLFYLLAKRQLAGYKRKYGNNNTQLQVPVYFYDSLSVVGLLHDDPGIYRSSLFISGLSGLKSYFIDVEKQQPVVMMHYTKENETGADSVFFMAEGFSRDLRSSRFAVVTPMSASLEKKLTFYDGGDYKWAADKDHNFINAIGSEGYTYYMSGRSDVNYYKELLLWKINAGNGHVLYQELIPRKIFYFDDRTRFKNIGVTAHQAYDGNFYSFVLEDEDNFEKGPHEFKFRKFSRQKYLWGANLVAYILRPDGGLEKKLVYKNKTKDFVPLNYSSDQKDFVFYLNAGKTEQFAILKLDGF